MNRDRLYALLATIAAMACILAVLMLAAIRFDRSTLPVPPRPTTAIVEQDEDFAELYTPEPSGRPAEQASPAYNPVEADNNATPAPATGTNTVDEGPKGQAEPVKTSTRPSPAKEVVREEPEKRGPAQDAQKKAEEEAKRRASADLKNAFANTQGRNNTDNKGKTEGNAGRPSGSTSSLQNGQGTGRVNGGWKMPSYAKVPSTVTGTIELKATIDRQGKVTAVEIIGGQAPAATNTALGEACKAEVRRRTFTRGDDRAPEQATAYITYRFN